MSNLVGLTGHTGALGRVLFNQFIQDGYEVLGFSRSNGYDIRDPDSRVKIIHQSQSCSYFINCAHSDFFQVYLLNELFESWRDCPNKIIFNISSDVVDEIDWEVVNRNYSSSAVALNCAISRLQGLKRRCRIVNLRLNHLNTDFNASYPGSKLNCEEVFRVMKFIIESPLTTEFKNISLAGFANRNE